MSFLVTGCVLDRGWLMGGLKPDHKTIARFRRDHREALKGVLKQCVRLCLKLGLIEGNTLFVDGTKIRANAGMRESWSAERCERALKEAEGVASRLSGPTSIPPIGTHLAGLMFSLPH